MAPLECEVLPLLDAAHDGDLALLKQLAREFKNVGGLASTFAIAKDEEGRNALHCAAAGGNSHICDYLVNEIKLDVDTKDGNGFTALHHSVVSGCLSTVRYLIRLGADISSTDSRGFTPLHIAAEAGRNGEILELLISRGASVDAEAESDTPLHCAAISGNKATVTVLLRHNANPNAVGHHLYTPLFGSIYARSSECLLLLLKAGADPNINTQGLTLLGYAAETKQPKMIEYMLKYGADPNDCGSHGLILTPLEIAALNNDLEIMKMLFPVTAPNPSIADWSIHGILEHIQSERSTELTAEESYAPFKEKGKDAFKKKDYLGAISWYTEAININPLDQTLFSNRSLCWLRLNDGAKALHDAVACIKLSPNWAKAHYREGAAYKILKNYEKAAAAFRKALQLDPHSEETEKELREVLKMAS